jgi:hypothetical protein
VIVALPLPALAEVISIQLSLLIAVQSQLVERLKLPAPPVTGKKALFEESWLLQTVRSRSQSDQRQRCSQAL